jgi:hypothetical protein
VLVDDCFGTKKLNGCAMVALVLTGGTMQTNAAWHGTLFAAAQRNAATRDRPPTRPLSINRPCGRLIAPPLSQTAAMTEARSTRSDADRAPTRGCKARSCRMLLAIDR